MVIAHAQLDAGQIPVAVRGDKAPRLVLPRPGQGGFVPKGRGGDSLSGGRKRPPNRSKAPPGADQGEGPLPGRRRRPPAFPGGDSRRKGPGRPAAGFPPSPPPKPKSLPTGRRPPPPGRGRPAPGRSKTVPGGDRSLPWDSRLWKIRRFRSGSLGWIFRWETAALSQ